LRGTPDRGAPIVQRIVAGDHIVTVAEVRTIVGSDGDFRLVEWVGRATLYALRSDWISDGIAIEPVTESNKDGYNTAMREISAYSAGKVIP
jgi:hypothetical protein